LGGKKVLKNFGKGGKMNKGDCESVTFLKSLEEE
jgi:hypothetical protein